MRTEADFSLRNIVINKIRMVDNVKKIYRFISTRVSSQKWNIQTDEYSFGISVFSIAYISFYVCLNDLLTVCSMFSLYPIKIQNFLNWISDLSIRNYSNYVPEA